MPTHRARRSTIVLDVLDEYLSTPARLLLTVVVLAIGLCVAGSTWPPVPTISAPVGVVAITPDDPAAATPVPVQLLGR